MELSERDSKIRSALAAVDFSRIDQVAGLDIIGEVRPLTTAQIDAAKRLIEKYKDQIVSAGIEIPSITEEETNGRIDVRKALKMLAVSFPFNLSTVQSARDLKEIVGGKSRYDGGAWLYPLSAVEEVLETFPHFSVSSDVAPLLAEQRRLKELKEANDQIRGQVLAKLREFNLDDPNLLQMECKEGFCRTHPEGSGGEVIGHPLMKHQKEFIRIALEEWKLICADDMGLGKTIETLVTAKIIQKATGCAVFVVARSSLRSKPWIRDAERVGVRIEVYSSSATKIPLPPERRKFVLIVDEAHDFQTLSAKRTQAILNLATSPNCIAAFPTTGTPIKNGRPANMWPLLVMVEHELSNDRRHFERRYCAAGPRKIQKKGAKKGATKNVWDVTGASHLDELHQKLGNKLVRRLKKNCVDLPPKTRMVEMAEFSPEAEEAYKKKLKDLVDAYRRRRAEKIAKGEKVGGGEVITMMGALRQASAMGKVPTAVNATLELVEQGRKVVIFAINLDTVKAVSAKLKDAGVEHELLTGEVADRDERDRMNHRFQNGSSKVFVMTNTGGVGIDLFAADTIIMIDRPWTPGDAMQIEDRLHRMGQTKNVTAMWLQYGDIDEKVDNVLVEKQERIDLVLEGKRRTMRGVEEIGTVVQDWIEAQL